MLYAIVQDADLDTMYGLCQWMEGYKHIQDNIFEVASKELLPSTAHITSSRVIDFKRLAKSICQCLGNNWQVSSSENSIAILKHVLGYSLVLQTSNWNSEKWRLHVQVNRWLSADKSEYSINRGRIELSELAKHNLHETFVFSKNRKVESITKFINEKILPNYVYCYQNSVIAHKEKMARFAKLVMEANKLASIVNTDISIRRKADVSFTKQSNKTKNRATALLNLQKEGKATGALTFENLSIEQMQVLLEAYKQVAQ